MTYLTVPRAGLCGRLKEPIPIFMDEVTALDRLYQGMIQLMPGIDYPEHIKSAAKAVTPY